MNARDESVWIGANDLEQEGVFLWMDGSRVNDNDMHWGPKTPHNFLDQKDCALMLGENRGYLAVDENCFSYRLGLCEKPVCIEG